MDGLCSLEMQFRQGLLYRAISASSSNSLQTLGLMIRCRSGPPEFPKCESPKGKKQDHFISSQ